MADQPEATTTPLENRVERVDEMEANGGTTGPSNEITQNKMGEEEQEIILEECVEEEEGEEEEQGDDISKMSDSSDSPEQKRQYMEYLSVIKEIKYQNQVIEEAKTKIKEIYAKECQTGDEIKLMKCLRKCMDEAFLKLRCLIEKAVQLQNFGSRRNYPDISIATTFEEDNLAPSDGPVLPSSSARKTVDGDSDENTCEDEDGNKNCGCGSEDD